MDESRTGWQSRLLRQDTDPVTGFQAGQGFASDSCPKLKPLRRPVSCLLTLFSYPVRNTALRKLVSNSSPGMKNLSLNLLSWTGCRGQGLTELAFHELECAPIVPTCKTCGARFLTHKQLRVHSTEHYNSTGLDEICLLVQNKPISRGQKFSCFKCDRLFWTERAVRLHNCIK